MTTSAGVTAYRSARAFGLKNTGKWIFAVRWDGLQSGATNIGASVGIGVASLALSLNSFVGFANNSGCIGWGRTTVTTTYTYDDTAQTNRAIINPALNDITHIAFDANSGNGWVGHNGTWLYGGNPETGANPTFTLAVGNNYLPMISYAEASGASAGIHTILTANQIGAIMASVPSFSYWTQ